jgi:two-component system cell cycle sensor histidine kinase/response regulator CckA
MTDISEFEQWIQAASIRFEQILQNTTHLPSGTPEIVAELSINIEELHVAVEELHQQNEELLATRQQLEQERQRYLELFDFAPDGYIVTNDEAIIQQVNWSASQLLNVPRKYLSGKPLDVFIAHADREAFNSQWQEITTGFAQACEISSRGNQKIGLNHYTTGSLIQDWEVHFQPRQGEPIPVAISLSATCNIEGELTKLLWLIRDLRYSKQAEAKIRQQAALLDVATDAIWVQDLEGNILYWNQGAENTYGWTAAETVDQSCHRLLFNPTASAWRKAHQTTVKRGQWQGELQNVTKSAEDILVESHWTLVHDFGDLPQSILMVDSNITEKKQLEKQLFQAQRLESLGTLAGGIAHDMNNILTPVIPIAQLLMLKFPNLDDHTRELLELIQASGRRGAALIKQILGFARGIEGTRMTMQLPPVIDEVTQIMTETFPKSIELRTHVPDDLWAICGDYNQLYQVLLNLCINARDAMAEGGILSLSAENWFGDEHFAQNHLGAEVGPYVAIAISDTGMGIPRENLDLIFDPFFTTKAVGEGTGLGLSTVAGIVKSHGGFIDVSSQMGQGSQFRVFLPAISVAEPICPEIEELFRGNGELILVVDDEAPIRQMNQTVLETYGYRVLTANEGFSGIELYTQHQSEISVVLMDMMMPSMDGATTIEALQEINPQVNIVAVSGLTNSKQIAQMMGNEIQAFLPKPYTSEELLSALHNVLA